MLQVVIPSRPFLTFLQQNHRAGSQRQFYSTYTSQQYYQRNSVTHFQVEQFNGCMISSIKYIVNITFIKTNIYTYIIAVEGQITKKEALMEYANS